MRHTTRADRRELSDGNARRYRSVDRDYSLGSLLDFLDPTTPEQDAADAAKLAKNAEQEAFAAGVKASQPVGAGTPGAAVFRPGNTDVERGEYRIAPGDTMYGLAILYYGNGALWSSRIRPLQTKPAGSVGPNGPYLNAQTTKWFPGSTAPGRAYQPGDVLLVDDEWLRAVQNLQEDGIPQGGTTNEPPGKERPSAPSEPSSPGGLLTFMKAHPVATIAAVGLGAFVVAKKMG